MCCAPGRTCSPRNPSASTSGPRAGSATRRGELGRFVRVSSEFPFLPGVHRAWPLAASGALGRCSRRVLLPAFERPRSDQAHQLEAAIEVLRRHRRDGRPRPARGARAAAARLEAGFGLRAAAKNLSDPAGRQGRHGADAIPGTTRCCTARRPSPARDAADAGDEALSAPTETNTWIFEVLGTDARRALFDQGAEDASGPSVATRSSGGRRPTSASGTCFKTITGAIFEPGFPDILQQMWAAFIAERAGLLGERFGCATPDEAVAQSRDLGRRAGLTPGATGCDPVSPIHEFLPRIARIDADDPCA
jgi:hypothetical protein